MKISYLLIIAVLAASCKSSVEVAEEPENFTVITSGQFASEKMELGTLHKMPFTSKVSCNATIVTSPNGTAEISIPLSGMVSKVFVTPGQRIIKGEALFELSGNGLIDLQKDFVAASLQKIRLQDEYDRVLLLYKENIGSKKEYQLTESEYKSALVNYNALALKLSQAGINAAEVENGKISSSGIIRSPINGMVSDIDMVLGHYVQEGDKLMEIIDTGQFLIKLAVFPKDINKLKAGQKVLFYPVEGDTSSCLAVLTSVGTTVDIELKAIECYAKPVNLNKYSLITNAYTNAEIVTGVDSVLCLPVDALLKSDNHYSLLKLAKQDKDNYYFSKTPVVTGRRYGDYLEIAGKNDYGSVLVRGAYNIAAE